MKETDDFLKQKLNTWDVKVTLPNDFQTQVWESIASKSTQPWYIELIQRPRLSFAFALVIIVMFASLGAVSGQHQNSKRMDKFKSHYIEKISPFVQATYNSEL